MSIVKNITSVDNLDWREIVINWEGMGDDVTEIKAGTPMDAEGNIANNGNCFGLMMGDVLRTRNRARVVISGPVDLDEAEANSGITLTDEAKAAMRDVWFPGKSGSGLPTGGAAYQQLVTDGEGNAKWEDRLAYNAVTTISWDGDTTDRVNAGGFAYKVSDLTPTKEELIGGIISLEPSGTHTLIANDFREGENWLIGFDSVIVSYADSVVVEGITIPEKGIYLFYQNSSRYASGLSWGKVKLLDSDLLPKNYNVLFTLGASGGITTYEAPKENVTCNCTYEELNAWLVTGTPIVAHFVSPGNYCATIQAFKVDDTGIRFLFTALDGGNLERTYKYIYNPSGTIVKQVE